jgi:hypothetical protein
MKKMPCGMMELRSSSTASCHLPMTFLLPQLHGDHPPQYLFHLYPPPPVFVSGLMGYKGGIVGVILVYSAGHLRHEEEVLWNDGAQN